MELKEPESGAEPRVSWYQQAYRRLPWVRVKYGTRVLHQNRQKSNLALADEDVMRRRDEGVGSSSAFPLAGGDGGNKPGPGYEVRG